MKIQLDTSSISEVLKTNETLLSFVTLAQRRRWKVSISRLVLQELFVTSAREWQVARCEQLLKLSEQLRGAFLIASSAREVWPIELDQRVSAALATPDFLKAMSQIRHVALTGKSEETELPLLGTAAREWKEAREEKSVLERAQGRAFFTQEGMTARGIGVELEKYGPRSIPEWIFESALRDLAGRPSFLVRRLYRERDRFLSLRAWAALIHMVMYADSIPPDLRTQHPNTSWLRSDRNNWFDAGVAASAAYVDAFITQDGNLTKCCRWLRKHQCLAFETMTLEQLYARGG
jgi:predicted nucleic acid-binding protein